MDVSENAPTTYEYKTVAAPSERVPLYRDVYQSFGWIVEPAPSSAPIALAPRRTNGRTLEMKRDRHIAHRDEVTRLQRESEAALGAIDKLEQSKDSTAKMAAFTIGLLGCALMALATFSYLDGALIAMVAFAVPGFLCWIAPYFVHRSLLVSRERALAPRIDRHYDTVYESCEQAAGLLRGAQAAPASGGVGAAC